MKMSSVYTITSITRSTPLLQTLNTVSLGKVAGIIGKSIHDLPSEVMMMSADPSHVQPGDFRRELPDADAASPVNPDRDLPSGVPRAPYNVPDFDHPEKPADPPPISPIGPEFPGPPNSSPPKPEAPRPPAPSPPGQPEVFPHHGHGPAIIPSKPPEPGAPNPTQPDIPVP